MFARLSPSRVIGLLALAAGTPALLHRTPMLAAVAATVVLAGVAAWDAIGERRHPGEAPSPPP